MKKFISAALALVIAIGLFSGCTLVSKDDSKVVVATVNGVPILKEKYNEMYNYNIYMYTSYYRLDSATAAKYINKTSLLEQLVQDELLRQKAEEAGYFNFTDEHRTAAQETVDKDKQTYIDNLVEEFTKAFEGKEVKGKNEGESDKDYFVRIATEKYLKNLKENGTSEEEMLQEQLKTDAVQRFKEDKLKDVTVLDADVLTKYNELYESQKQELTTDKLFVSGWNQGYVKSSSDSNKQVSCDPMIYYRAGYSLVMQILIKFEEDDVKTLQGYVDSISNCDETIEDNKKKIEEETDEAKKAEYQQLIDNAEAEKKGLQDKYNTALTGAKSKIQSKTDEVYNSVKDADEAKFIEVIVDKSEDTGMQTEEAAKKGYLVGPEDGMVTEFSQAATALKAGEVSEPTATYYGYHIIRCIRNLPEGKVDFENVKEKLTEQLTTEKKNTEWDSMIKAWKSESKIKTYENKL